MSDGNKRAPSESADQETTGREGNYVTFGSLFAGIGGFDLGFERAGMTCAWQVEIDPYCQKVLAKHWPDVRRHDDVRTFPPEGDWSVDVICGGFPCQDISNAGKRAGITGERSGLWTEYARIIRHLRPRYVVVENVAALLARGMDRVLGDLAESGYDAEWQSIPASSFGAWHKRNRVWIVAYSQRLGCESRSGRTGPSGKRRTESAACGEVSHAIVSGLEGHERRELEESIEGRFNANATGSGWWTTEPALGRVAHGVPDRVDRLKGLGNAVVPQVAEWIGRRIMAADSNHTGG